MVRTKNANVSLTLNTTLSEASVSDTSADNKNICDAYNSTLTVCFDNLINDGLVDTTSKCTLNPNAKCFNPTPVDNINNGVIVGESPTGCKTDDIVTNIVDNGDVYSIINKVRTENANRIIIAHLNINSIRNKIDMLSDIVKNKIDILCITESKLDDTFPLSNFLIAGFIIFLLFY